MKVVVPTDDRKGLLSPVAEHFGRCETYTFLDENGRVVEIIGNTSEHMGGSGLPPELMMRHGADVLLCKGLGPRALELCRIYGIDIYVCDAETVGEIFALWKNKKIKQANSEDVCEAHKK